MAIPSDSNPRPLVLLIEDNLTQGDLYAIVLGQRFEIVTANRGASGYLMACSVAPRVIILDMLLPDEDGLQLSKRLRENAATAHIPIIAFTADDGAYARAKLAEPRFSAVLLKPCPAERLMSAVESAIADASLKGA
jgi:CheY-like chemotaxis protein